MSTPDYMSKIQEVATDGAVAAEMLENDVMRAWVEFCSHAADLEQPYDILSSSCVDGRLIGLAESLVTVLYRASPGTPEQDCAQIREKNAAYGGSWAKRGGTGAFHALARKGDRLDEQLRLHKTFANCRSLPSGESIDDTLGDLRRYLILVLAWHRAEDGAVEERLQLAEKEIEESLSEDSLVRCAACGCSRSEHAGSTDLSAVLESGACDTPCRTCECRRFVEFQ